MRVRIDRGIYDPTDPMGRLLVNVLALVAEFEADLISARTKGGHRHRSGLGRLKGKPRKLNAKQAKYLVELHDAHTHSAAVDVDMLRGDSEALEFGYGSAQVCLGGRAASVAVSAAPSAAFGSGRSLFVSIAAAWVVNARGVHCASSSR